MVKNCLAGLLGGIILCFASFGSSSLKQKLRQTKTRYENARDEITKHRQELKKIQASIQQVEAELGGKNGLYLQKIEAYNELSSSLEQLDKRTLVIRSDLKKTNASLFKTYATAMVNAIERKTQSQLLELELSKKVMSIYARLSSKLQKDLDLFESERREIAGKLKRIEKQEDGLYHRIVAIEKQRELLEQSFQQRQEMLENLQNHLVETEVKLEETKDQYLKIAPQRGDFSPPLPGVKNVSVSGKGLSFKVYAQAPVLATGAGRVVHVGELANYGQVIMVDHGDDVRSVYLGNVRPHVSNGDEVVREQELAVFEFKKDSPGEELYFEIRKRNQVQATEKWLASSGRSRKKL